MSNSKNKSILGHFIWTLSGQYYILFCNLLNSIMLSRILLPEGRGKVALAILYPTIIANVAAAGLGNISTWVLSKNPQKARGWFSHISITGVTIAVFASILCCFLLPYIIKNPEDLSLATFYILTIPILIFNSIIYGCFAGLMRFDLLAMFQSIGISLITFSILILTFLNFFTPLTYLYVLLTGSTIQLLLGLIILATHTSGSWRPYTPGGTRKFYFKLVPLLWVNIFRTQSDRLLLTTLLPNQSAKFGIYIASTSISNMVLPCITAIQNVLFPHSARASKEEVLSMFKQTIRIYNLIYFLIAIILILSIELLISLAFGKAFAGGGNYARLAIIALGLYGVNLQAISVLQGQGRPELATFYGLTIFIVSAVISIFCVLQFNYYGALLGNICGNFFGILILPYFLKGVSFSELIPGRKEINLSIYSVKNLIRKTFFFIFNKR